MSNVASLIPNEDKLIEGEFNVMLIGKHGTGKTESVRTLAARHGLTVKSFSCSTLDPYTDFVGVPVPKQDENGRDYLQMVRPRDIDEADILFFDELNRARPEIQNAVLEIINNRTINGEPLPNLKGCWAAINPADEDYKVDDLDPALWDRFDVYIEVQPKPSVAYMQTVMPKPIAQALMAWYNDHNKGKRKDYVSPRRLVKLGLVYEVTRSKRALKQALPPGGTYDSEKLWTLLDEAMNPEKKQARLQKQADVEKEFDQSFPIKTAKNIKDNKDKVINWLEKNPNSLDGHRKVSKALEKGVGSIKIFKDGYCEVLDRLHPTILEAYMTKQTPAKLSQMRSCFRTLYTTEHQYSFGPSNGIVKNKALAKSLPNLHTAINNATTDKSAKMPALPK